MVGLQEIAGFSEVGFERVRLRLRLDGRALLGVHLFLGGDLQAQTHVRHAHTFTGRGSTTDTGGVQTPRSVIKLRFGFASHYTYLK